MITPFLQRLLEPITVSPHDIRVFALRLVYLTADMLILTSGKERCVIFSFLQNLRFIRRTQTLKFILID